LSKGHSWQELMYQWSYVASFQHAPSLRHSKLSTCLKSLDVRCQALRSCSKVRRNQGGRSCHGRTANAVRRQGLLQNARMTRLPLCMTGIHDLAIDFNWQEARSSTPFETAKHLTLLRLAIPISFHMITSGGGCSTI